MVVNAPEAAPLINGMVVAALAGGITSAGAIVKKRCK